MYERYVANCVGKIDVCIILDAFEEFLLEIHWNIHQMRNLAILI